MAGQGDLKGPETRWLERLRLTAVRYLPKHLVHNGSGPQIRQITLIFKKLAWLDRLKKWEPVRHKNELAYFCVPGFPIAPKAQPWDPRVAEFQRSLHPILDIL
jgi:hypothetical protein